MFNRKYYPQYGTSRYDKVKQPNLLTPEEKLKLNVYLDKLRSRLSPSSVADETGKHSQLGASSNVNSSIQ